MLKFITVIVICYFGKLENNKSSIFGPATIFWTRDNLPATRDNLPATRDNLPATRDTRRLDYLFSVTFSMFRPFNFTSKNCTFRLYCIMFFKRDLATNFIDNLFVVGMRFSFFVEFVDLFLKMTFHRFSLFCLIFRIFDCKTSYSD